MYREKARTFTVRQQEEFKESLAQFADAFTIRGRNSDALIPQLRNVHFIASVYRYWNDLKWNYSLPRRFNFAEEIMSFEDARRKHPNESPYLQFTSALSNAGYAKNRLDTRHEILLYWTLQRHPRLALKDKRRSFSLEQKIAIWYRAAGQCEAEKNGVRCLESFANPREADADHIVKWRDGGLTTYENGRLLCVQHNRGRR
jgi:hypothetical protein